MFNCFIRSSDGQLLIVSSSDGFCSIISFSKEELGETYMEQAKIEMMETEECSAQDDVEKVSNKITPVKIKEKEEEKQSSDFSEPPTKKRVQLVTLSSPKTKKCLNK